MNTKIIQYAGGDPKRPQMFETVPCAISDLSWKCPENLFIHFFVMPLTGKHAKKSTEMKA